jgi:molybdopterin-containing oxidoreductase family membrane subunit
MIVSPTLSLGYHPFAFDVMWPTVVSWAIVFGSFGWFGLLFLVFVKIFPSVSMYEVKEMVYHRRRHTVRADQAEAFHRRAGDIQPRPAAETPGT